MWHKTFQLPGDNQPSVPGYFELGYIDPFEGRRMRRDGQAPLNETGENQRENGANWDR